MTNRAPFIVFEGIEGVGKSTQIEKLSERILSTGAQVIRTHEPGATVLGKEIRKLLLESAKTTQISELSELLLFSADRAQHIEEIIKPNLTNNTTVLCDRFFYSTIAYQCFGRGVSVDTFNKINSIVTEGFRPDLVILLDIDPKIGLERAKKRQELDRIESLALDFHYRVRAGFLELAEKNNDIFLKINAEETIDNISEKIIREYKTRFGS